MGWGVIVLLDKMVSTMMPRIVNNAMLITINNFIIIVLEIKLVVALLLDKMLPAGSNVVRMIMWRDVRWMKWIRFHRNGCWSGCWSGCWIWRSRVGFLPS